MSNNNWQEGGKALMSLGCLIMLVPIVLALLVFLIAFIIALFQQL